ncbi:unnamed protein product [Spodoptera littoralis]|uniref:Peptidase S1 domain-containing protein n=1 Tax=Spodoptera littoralis TaxID=7109 RepID=A0A9P0I7D5_SPOLI|nr:unnamed protein product [Spodoptera littoralis]CAH1641525.1 unnamed protein product [Spodoptera littoralis]
MFTIKSELVLLFVFLLETYCQRRIQEGNEVTKDKPYVVYLVKAPIASVHYDFWLCGGALVTSEYVVTSAACIKDVDYLYVIAGYNKYVTDAELETDKCTSKMKKKVIYTCYPEGYEIRYERLDKWALIDIGVVKVESPYDFTDESYKTTCSYVPTVIPVSYEARYQEPGTDAIVFGWGHLVKWRKGSDARNHNQEKLNYAPVMIIDKEECKKHYTDYENMTEVIDKYMICTYGPGNIDDRGDPVEPGKPEHDGCKPKEKNKETCKNKDNAESRRFIEMTNLPLNETETKKEKQTNSKQVNVSNETPFINETIIRKRPLVYGIDGRRHGICQNDHGGPLVTWVGTHEILIGIASVFKVSEDSECVGPFLYTSTQCNGAFLDCILTTDKLVIPIKKKKSNTRRAVCRKRPEDEGHPTVERHISWLYHPAGAAENEKIGRNGDITTPEPAEENTQHAETPIVDINSEAHARNITQDYLNVHKPIPNNQFEGNERYPAINNYGNNYQYAPNGYVANEQYFQNQQYGTNHFIPANNPVPNNNVPVNWGTQNGNYLAQRPVPIGRYNPNVMLPPIIRSPVPMSGPTLTNRRPPEIYKPPLAPASIPEKTMDSQNQELFRMRPQVPLHV